jgi:hypothetical protein
VANRLVPKAAAPAILRMLTNRPAETIFPAFYDACTYTGLKRAFADWSHVRIDPKFRGAAYFCRSPRAQRLYLGYEDWAANSGRQNLATHYLLSAYR